MRSRCPPRIDSLKSFAALRLDKFVVDKETDGLLISYPVREDKVNSSVHGAAIDAENTVRTSRR